jgi:endonuclease I
MKIVHTIFFISLSLTSLATELGREEIVQMTKKNHKPLVYQKVKILLFSTVENLNNTVCSVYTPSQCKETHYKLNPTNKTNNYNYKLNVEHTWPQSKGSKEFPAVSDMHHLFVTSKESNSKRANLPFCDTVYDYWQMDGSIQGFDEYSQDCFEPQDNHKGNVARAMFYFSIRYEFQIDENQEEILRLWNASDPVDELELKRNEIVQKLQGNSNPFITNNYLVNQISNF